jgi:hypothetical protein
MGRVTQPSYITPIKSDGTLAVESAGDTAFGAQNNRGVFTLAAATYFVPIPAADALIASLHTQGDATIAITSVTIEETNLAPSDVSDYSDVTGEWFAVDAARIVSGVEGTGWTATSDVIANTAGNQGGGFQNVTDLGARRMRAKVVVGTGGQARFAAWAKD